MHCVGAGGWWTRDVHGDAFPLRLERCRHPRGGGGGGGGGGIGAGGAQRPDALVMHVGCDKFSI